MKAINATAAIVLAFGLAAASSAQAEFKCDKPQLTRVDAIACAKAAQSVQELARYVQRTRTVHALYLPDYVKPASQSADASAKAPIQTASAATR